MQNKNSPKLYCFGNNFNFLIPKSLQKVWSSELYIHESSSPPLSYPQIFLPLPFTKLHAIYAFSIEKQNIFVIERSIEDNNYYSNEYYRLKLSDLRLRLN